MTEEETIVDYILDLDWRGFPLRLTAVKDLADSLLAARNREPVSQSWAKTSVKRWPKLSTKFNRKYDLEVFKSTFRSVLFLPVMGEEAFERVCISLWYRRRKIRRVKLSYDTSLFIPCFSTLRTSKF